MGNQEVRRASLIKRILEELKKDIVTSIPPEERESIAQDKLTEMFGEGWKAEAMLPEVTIVEVESEVGEGPEDEEEVEQLWRNIQEFADLKGISDTEYLQYNHGRSSEPSVNKKRYGEGEKLEKIRCHMDKIMKLIDGEG